MHSTYGSRSPRQRNLTAGLLLLSLVATACGSRQTGSDALTGTSQVVAGQVQGSSSDGTAGTGTSADGSADTGGPTGDVAGGTTGSTGSAAGTTGTTTSGGGTTGAGRSGSSGTSGSSGSTSGTGAAKPGAGGGISISGPSSQGVSDGQIKIGIIAPLSGAAGFLGEAQVAGIRAYSSLVNAKGGIKGRKLSTIVVDSQFSPDLEAQATRKLIDKDKVFALFSVIGDSAAPYVTSKGIPNFVIGMAPPPFSSKFPTTYPVGASSMDSVARMAYLLKVIQKKPINSTAILYDTQNIPIGPWVKYLSKAWTALGVQVKSEDKFNVSDGDCTNVVLKMQSQNIDFWQAGQSLAWPACAAAMGRQNYQPKYGKGGPYTGDNKYISQGGIGMDGALGGQSGIHIVKNTGQPYPYEGGPPSTVAPETQNYINSVKKYAPNSSDSDTLESIWSQAMWVGTKALTQAVEAQTDAVTWKGVNQWLQGQKRYISGLISPINFSPKCKSAAPFYHYTWKFNKANNKFEESSWKDWGAPFTMPDSYLNKIFPGAGQCYLTAAADAEL